MVLSLRTASTGGSDMDLEDELLELEERMPGSC